MHMHIKAYQVYIYIRVTKTILSEISIFNWEGLFAGGWGGPEWRGGVCPATRAYDDGYFVFSNTMFYVDRLHIILPTQRASCFDFLGNAMRLFSTWVPGYPKSTTPNN